MQDSWYLDSGIFVEFHLFLHPVNSDFRTTLYFSSSSNLYYIWFSISFIGRYRIIEQIEHQKIDAYGVLNYGDFSF